MCFSRRIAKYWTPIPYLCETHLIYTLIWTWVSCYLFYCFFDLSFPVKIPLCLSFYTFITYNIHVGLLLPFATFFRRSSSEIPQKSWYINGTVCVCACVCMCMYECKPEWYDEWIDVYVLNTHMYSRTYKIFCHFMRFWKKETCIYIHMSMIQSAILIQSTLTLGGYIHWFWIITNPTDNF